MVFPSSFSTKPFNLRYTIYLAEIQKRFLYIVLCVSLALLSAYAERVSLMYLMTCSLQKNLFGEKSALKGWEFFETIKHNALWALKELEISLPFYPGWQVPAQQELSLSVYPHSTCVSSGGAEEVAEHGYGSVRLIFTDVEEAFYTLVSVSIFWCFLASFPVLVYHTLCFFQPGFYAWQSKRVWFSVSWRVCFMYWVLHLVHLFVIPRLLSFFYSFEIARSSLCLHAETKVVSYVSLYVFVYCITVGLLSFAGIWGVYKQRQILRWLHVVCPVTEHNLCEDTAFQNTRASLVRSESALKQLYRSADPQFASATHRHKDQRGKVWWGCLLLSAFLSPPEISSQLACSFFLILLSEISVWLAYASSLRLWKKAYPYSLQAGGRLRSF